MSKAILALVLFAAAAGARAASLELELDVPDEVSLANRPSSVGTNVRYARVARSKLTAGRMEQMIAPPIVEALARCRPRSEGATMRVRVAEGEMKDSIGESTTKLKGIGIYFNLPQTGVVDTGTWSASVFVALKLEVKDGGGAVVATHEIATYDREAAPEGMTAGDFMAIQAKGMEPRMESLIRTHVSKAMPALLEKVCA